MTKRMLININEPEEKRIAIVEDDKLEEIYIERISSLGHVNNIYKGRVVNIEPSIQAAFVDIGEGRNGFLHVSDVMPIYGEMNGNKQNNRKKEKKIQNMLREGMEVLTQITKEGIGNKAPTLTTYLSIPSRYIVLMPSIKRTGVSKKIEDESVRKKLKAILSTISPPPDMGYIIRTAGARQTEKEIASDLKYLLNLWNIITKKARYARSPCLIYQESDLVIRVLRDIFTVAIEEIIVDTPEAYQRALDFIEVLSPDLKKRVKHYSDETPLFYKYGIENKVEEIYKKRVALKSGGHVIIEQTEALIAIDVNSGKYTDEIDIEKTALKINLEAAEEIARQLRLRDLGGVIINDFIDMKSSQNKRIVERAFREAIRKDRARSRVGRISQFGIIEMTRQRLGPSIKSYTHNLCHYCNGQGWIKNIESISLLIMRKIKLAILSKKVNKICVTANSEVALNLANKKRNVLHNLEKKSGTKILINSSNNYSIEKYTVDYY